MSRGVLAAALLNLHMGLSRVIILRCLLLLCISSKGLLIEISRGQKTQESVLWDVFSPFDLSMYCNS